MDNRPKVIKLIWWIPHYRVPVFRRLSQNPDLDFTVCAGDNSLNFGGEKVASASDVGNADGVNWRRLDSRRLKMPLFRRYEWQPEAVRIAWRDDIDAVISLGNKSLSNWLVRLICRLRGIPVLEWSIGVMGPERGLKWAVRKFYLKWARVHLLYGTWARDFYVRHGFDEKEVFVVRNSLDHDSQVAVRENITEKELLETRRRFEVTAPEDRLLFHSGRLEAKKNLPVLLEALSRLKKQGRKIVLVLIGDGRDEAMLRECVRAKDIEDRVVFFGPCYDEMVLGHIISASDLCVVPGVTGLIAMHSLVYGTPILTRHNTAYEHGPEVEAVIEGKTGGYFRDNDIDDLVDKMGAFLYPTSCKSRMSEACMEIIDREFTPEYQERVVIEALNSVLPRDKRIPVPDQTRTKTSKSCGAG